MTYQTQFERLSAERAAYVDCAIKAVNRPYGKTRTELMDRAIKAIESFDQDHPQVRATLSSQKAA